MRFQAGKTLFLAVIVVLAWALNSLTGPCPIRYPPLQRPSMELPLGSDPIGRNALCVIARGVWESVEAGLSGMAASIILLTAALTAGVSPIADRTIGFTSKLLAGLPRMGLLLLLALLARPGPLLVGALIGALAGVQAAQSVASRAKQIAGTAYVEAARSIGASRARIVLKHILPNAWSAIASYASISSAAAVFAEAGLSMLGLGRAGTPSLGKTVSLVLLAPGAPLTLPGILQVGAALLGIVGIAAVFYEILRLPYETNTGEERVEY